MGRRKRETTGRGAAPVDGLGALKADQLELLEKQLDRQETAMTGRLSNANTRAAILIGVSGAVGGTALVTSSGNIWISAASLVLYVVAAGCGLMAMRSRVAEQPALAPLIGEYAESATISMRQSLLSGRLVSHERSRALLDDRHGWLVRGFVALMLAWLASGAGTIYGLTHPKPEPTTPIHIEIDGVNR